jgi:hypothetical protein
MSTKIQNKKETYEFINLTLWWFKIPEVLATITVVLGLGIYLATGDMKIFFCGFWMRIIMVPLRLIFVNWKRNLEKEIPSLTRQKFSGQDAYKTIDRVYGMFRK